MTIHELTGILSSALTANDEVPIWDAEAGSGEEPTKKVTLQNLANALATIGRFISQHPAVLEPQYTILYLYWGSDGHLHVVTNDSTDHTV